MIYKIMVKPILTIYFPYYNSKDALKSQLTRYAHYPKSILKQIQFIVVDDGSREHPAKDYISEVHLENLNLLLMRINIDIPWNMPEANNLALSKCETDWIFRTDIDHFIDINGLKILLKFEKNANIIYSFGRYDAINQTEKPGHPNTYLIHRETYDKIGGYNEYFSGNYGHDDSDFLMRARMKGVPIVKTDLKIINIPGYRTDNVVRDPTVNRGKLQENTKPLIKFAHKEKYEIQVINNPYNNQDDQIDESVDK